MRVTAITAALMLAIAAPAAAQLGGLGKMVDNASKAKSTFDDLNFTDAEEQQMGSEISAKLREKYGVVQDKAVHKYVTLVGTVLAQSSTRPNLKWTFIVLDTDGINAFAAPGGFVHITRGALGLIRNESELADVLGHEIGHITEKHTIHAIQKSKGVNLASNATRSQILSAFADQGYSMLLDNKFSRSEEIDADTAGIKLGNGIGYAPSGMGAFLTRLMERNKDLKEPSGIFASHPDSQARLSSLTKVIAASKLTAAATVAPRYLQNIEYKPVDLASIPQVAPPSGEPAKPASSGSKFGVSGLSATGNQSSSSQTISSAGSRGANPDRDAKGGPVKTIVITTVTPAEVDAFRKGIAG